MSKLYLVTYSLKSGGVSTALEEELKTASKWWHFIDNTWIIETEDPTAVKVWERISVAHSFGGGDRLLAIEISPAASRQGWLPTKAWDWLRARAKI